jgi:ABC-type transporter Mla maintaining outer membrane lipid asymmetry permease subunit MlaE
MPGHAGQLPVLSVREFADWPLAAKASVGLVAPAVLAALWSVPACSIFLLRLAAAKGGGMQIGPSPAVLGANFKDTVEKFLTPSATHNSMTKAAFIAIATHATLHGIKSE